jgi:hypothetical protein
MLTATLAAATLLVAACHSGDPVERTCAAGRFEARARTVHDTQTKFTWERRPPLEKMDWDHAQEHCKSIGMSLPMSLSMMELMKTGPSAQEPFDTCAFPSTSSDASPDDAFASGVFWTGTSNALPVVGKWLGENTEEMVVVFGRAELGHDPKSALHRVRCWRDF